MTSRNVFIVCDFIPQNEGRFVQTLINASPKTLELTDKILRQIKKRIPNVIIHKSKHWVSIGSHNVQKKIALLQPQKKRIRIYYRMSPDQHKNLIEVPRWRGFSYRSKFYIDTTKDIEKAVQFIVKAYKDNCQKKN